MISSPAASPPIRKRRTTGRAFGLGLFSLPQLADDLAADDSNSCQAVMWGIPASAGAGCLPVPPPRIQINQFAHCIHSYVPSRKRELGGRLFACLQKGLAS